MRHKTKQKRKFSAGRGDDNDDMDDSILVCFDENYEDLLPQAESEEDVMLDLLQERYNQTRSIAAGCIHGQCDELGGDVVGNFYDDE